MAIAQYIILAFVSPLAALFFWAFAIHWRYYDLSFWFSAYFNIRRIHAEAFSKLGLRCVDRRGIQCSANIAGLELQFGNHVLGFKDREPNGWR
jgi:hypothetical protein